MKNRDRRVGLLSGMALVGTLLSGHPAIAQSSLSYSYDALGRLVEVKEANGAVTTYSYDAAGNRTQVTSSGVPAPVPPPPPPAPAPTPSASFIVLPLLGGFVIPIQP